MCYFLQSQVWHEETENVMSRLSDTSSKVATKIEESSDVQERIISNQKETLEYQRQIVANGSILSKAIELSKVNVREMLAEFKSSTDEQRGMIFEIFERVNKLQNMVVSEVSWLYTVFFYGSCLLIVYLGTATRRTADARLWLYCVLSINFLLERAICQSSLPSDGQQDVSEDLPETIYHRIWLIRKTSIFACFCVTGYIAVKYVDYNRVNNKLLEDIRKQNADLKMKMEAMQVMSKQGNNEGGPNSAAATSTTDGGSAATRFDLTDAGGFATNPFFPEDHVTDLGELAEDESSSDDTISVNSTMTDRTYLGGTMEQTTELSEESDSGDEDEFMTALNSKEHSPKSLAAQQFLTGPGNKSGRVSRSSKGGKTTPRTSSRATTPLQSPNHSYNLRTRASTLINNNPILEEESPESFHKTVLAKLKVTQRNSAKLSLALKKASMYSSDEN